MNIGKIVQTPKFGDLLQTCIRFTWANFCQPHFSVIQRPEPVRLNN